MCVQTCVNNNNNIQIDARAVFATCNAIIILDASRYYYYYYVCIVI